MNNKEVTYVDAIRVGDKGYNIYIHRGNENHIIRNCHPHVVEVMFGEEMKYLLNAITGGTELSIPLADHELRYLMKKKAISNL